MALDVVLAVLAFFALVAVGAGIMITSIGPTPQVHPSVTPYPGGWTLEPKSWGTATEALPTVYVQENLPSSWDVKGSLTFVDKYTKSKAKLVKACPAGVARCVKIKSGKVGGSPIAWTDCKSGKCTITVDVKDATKTGLFNAKTRRWLVAHELGHVFGLEHRASCSTTMFQYRRCSGKIPPLSFDKAQKGTLATR
jgi:hypothetical protein